MYAQNESDPQVPSAPEARTDAPISRPAVDEASLVAARLDFLKAIDKLIAGAEHQREAEKQSQARAERYLRIALLIDLIGAAVIIVGICGAVYLSMLAAIGLVLPLAAPWGFSRKLAADTSLRHFTAAQSCRRVAARLDMLASAAQLATTDEARTELALTLARETAVIAEMIEKEGYQSGKVGKLSHICAKVLGWIPRRTNRRLVPALGG